MAERTYREVSKLNSMKRDMIKNGAPSDQVRAMEERITARMKAFNAQAQRLREPAT
jgi:hypothetical protein